jgi:hypothetical protein
MKLSQLLLTTSLCAMIAMPAFAQSTRTFNEVDTDLDGELSQIELETAFGANGSALFLNQNDRDGDGNVSVAEIQMSQDDARSVGGNDNDSNIAGNATAVYSGSDNDSNESHVGGSDNDSNESHDSNGSDDDNDSNESDDD